MANPWTSMAPDVKPTDEAFVRDFASHPPTTPGFSPSFILPNLFLSGDSVPVSVLWKQGVRFIIDARMESSLRQLANDVVKRGPNAPAAKPIDEDLTESPYAPPPPPGLRDNEPQFYDVVYRDGYRSPTLTAATLTIFPSQEEAMKVLATRRRTGDDDQEEVGGKHFVVMNIPALDHERFNLSNFFKQAAEVLDFALTEAGVGVLVHCAAGVSRSPSLIACYLIKKFNLPVERVVPFLRQRRPMVFPNFGFAKQLSVWAELGREMPPPEVDPAAELYQIEVQPVKYTRTTN